MGSRKWTPRVKVWLESDGRYVFGYGIARILESVDRLGSIRAAADELGKSYRYIWGRIKKLEERLGRKLVVTKVGGAGSQRSEVTPAGKRLTQAFLDLRRELQHTATSRGREFPT